MSQRFPWTEGAKTGLEEKTEIKSSFFPGCSVNSRPITERKKAKRKQFWIKFANYLKISVLRVCVCKIIIIIIIITIIIIINITIIIIIIIILAIIIIMIMLFEEAVAS